MSPQLIAVVDDDSGTVLVCESVLRAAGYQTAGFTNPNEFLRAEAGRLAGLVTGLVMPGCEPLDYLKGARSRHPHVPILTVSGYPSLELIAKALEITGGEHLAKPFDLGVFRTTAERLFGAGMKA